MEMIFGYCVYMFDSCQVVLEIGEVGNKRVKVGCFFKNSNMHVG